MFRNKDIYQFHMQIEQMKGNVIFNLLFGKIKEFYKHNSIRLNTLIEKVSAMQEEYFVLENDKVKHEGEGAEQKPVMKEGKTYEEYLEKYNELMEKECPIKF